MIIVSCSYCSDEIHYMPYKCRYCGKSYCSKHRIPENHDCSFEFKDDPYLVKPIRAYTDNSGYNYSSESYSDNFSEQTDPKANVSRNLESIFGNRTKPKATYSLMIISFIIFIIGGISSVNQYISLSLTDFIPPNYMYYTLITSIFYPENIFGLIIDMLIIWSIGKMVENRFGPKVFIQIYVISGLITGIGVIALQFIFKEYPIIFNETITGFSTSSGAFMGLISFIILLLPKGGFNILLFSKQIHLKPSYILWSYIALNFIMGLISFFAPDDYNYIIYFADIFGILGGYLKIRSLRRTPLQQF